MGNLKDGMIAIGSSGLRMCIRYFQTSMKNDDVKTAFTSIDIAFSWLRECKKG
jgi:hypothetical protein